MVGLPRTAITQCSVWPRNQFPAPDLAVVLSAPAQVLLARKRELSETEIRRQTTILETMKIHAGKTIHLDATQPPAILAEAILNAANEIQFASRSAAWGQTT